MTILEGQREAAMRAVLRTISESPSDFRPVFEAIMEHATKLCDASFGGLFMCESGFLQLVAQRGMSSQLVEFLTNDPLPLDPSQSFTAQAAYERRPVQVEDVGKHEASRGQRHRVAGQTFDNIHTQVCVPIVLGDECLGVVSMYRGEVRRFEPEHVELASAFAEQAAIAVENVRRFKALEVRTAELAKALERQSATTDILRVINRSPSDFEPVFEAILAHATRLCDAPYGALLMCESGHFRMVAHQGVSSSTVELMQAEPMPIDANQNISAQAVVEMRPISVDDVREHAATHGHRHREATIVSEEIRSQISVPLISGDAALGVISVWRREVRPFAQAHIDLVCAFAEQGVIGVENVRRFRALEDRTSQLSKAFERQSATAEVLRVISRSPTDSQPVFEAILEKAGRICDAAFGGMFVVRDEYLVPVAWLGESTEYRTLLERAPLRLDSERLLPRSARSGEALHVEDMSQTSEYVEQDPYRVAAVDVEGMRTVLCVPLHKDGVPVGAIAVFRHEKRLFRDEDIELLKTFADQAVIAIDNARMFEAVNARTGEVRAALARQTATSEILRVISSSPTESQPVFEAILERAGSICDASLGCMLLVRDDRLHPAAWLEPTDKFKAATEANPLPLSTQHSFAHRSALTGEIVHIEDLSDGTHQVDGGDGAVLRRISIEEERIRTLLCIPLRKDDKPVGVLCLFRREKRLFKDEDIDLLSTFAEQAVIAIENVRLFQTLQSQRAELTRSVGELRALGEVGQAVSSTLDLDTVLTTITSQAVALCGAAGGVIAEYDEATGTLPIRAAPGFTHLVGGIEPTRIGEGVIGKAAADRQPVHIPDLDAPGAYPGKLRHLLDQAGLKALLAVPLLREDRVLGTLLVGRGTTGEFPQSTIDLLETFAAQSALAIHNARVYRELEEQGRALDAANRHKSEFLANMSHELRTPLNAVIGFSEVLGDELFGELNEKQGEYVKDIHESGRHLLSLINDILDLSKVEAGQMDLDLSRFALHPAIDNALTLVNDRAARRGLDLKSRIDELPQEMVGDERKFKQVLLNLLSNAIKFTPAGGQVTVSGRLKDSWVEIEVSDTGVGISVEEQSRVFDAFQQAGRDYARKAEGTGLGLTLTRQFVELHGGSIKVESAPEQGSTFTIMLPLEPGASEQV